MPTARPRVSVGRMRSVLQQGERQPPSRPASPFDSGPRWCRLVRRIARLPPALRHEQAGFAGQLPQRSHPHPVHLQQPALPGLRHQLLQSPFAPLRELATTAATNRGAARSFLEIHPGLSRPIGQEVVGGKGFACGAVNPPSNPVIPPPAGRPRACGRDQFTDRPRRLGENRGGIRMARWPENSPGPAPARPAAKHRSSTPLHHDQPPMPRVTRSRLRR